MTEVELFIPLIRANIIIESDKIEAFERELELFRVTATMLGYSFKLLKDVPDNYLILEKDGQEEYHIGFKRMTLKNKKTVSIRVYDKINRKAVSRSLDNGDGLINAIKKLRDRLIYE